MFDFVSPLIVYVSLVDMFVFGLPLVFPDTSQINKKSNNSNVIIIIIINLL